MASTSFLSEFPPASTADWERAIRETVTEPEYAAKLIWRPEELLALKPYYTAEDLREIDFLTSAPGEFPYVRGSRAEGAWRVREEIKVSNPEGGNRTALDAVGAGAEEISFSNAVIASQAELSLLLANLDEIPVRFQGLDLESAPTIATWLGTVRSGSCVSADLDPLADLDLSAQVCRRLPGSRLLTLSADNYEERGLGAIEQIALLLSASVEFLEGMLERGLDIAQATKGLGFSFSAGPKFIVEIAKLRAFRLVWAKVVESFGGDTECAKAVIFARTTHWNETVYDSHVNVLRATTEAISAILGGADSVAVAPFVECYRRPDESTRRLARNVQLILKRESEFTRVVDPLGGAYAVEALTSTIATKAWKMFQEFETAGGYRKVKADATIESLADRRTAERDVLTRSRRLVLTGTNRFANPGERALNQLEGDQSDRRPRVASGFEQIRFRTERAELAGKLPRVLLAEFGDPKMRGLRAQFAADFLACAGLSGRSRYVKNPAEVIQEEAELIVLCSADPEYLPFAVELMPLLSQVHSSAEVVIAGRPENVEQLKRLGIDDFIYLGCDAVKVLEKIQLKLRIED